MNEYHHGVRVVEINDGARPIRAISTAVIGMVVTAPDADVDAFPVNELVQITNVQDALGKIGATGTGPKALEAIKDHGSPIIHMIVVPEGATPEETTANVIGTNEDGQRTGLQALRTAKQKFGFKPRILGVPELDTLAVTVELAGIASDTKSFAYAIARKEDGSVADTVAEAVAYRNNFGSRELMIIHPEFIVADGTGNHVNESSVSRALGLRAYLDENFGWHKTISNIPVQGVLGISKSISWELQDPSTDAGLLNASEVTTLINEDGYRFWGSRTCSDDPLYAFESDTRTAQTIADMIARAHLWAVDKPLYASLARDIVEGLNAEGRNLVGSGYLLGFEAYIDNSLNTAESLGQGKLYIDYEYTAVPPLENLNLRQRVSDRYLLNFAQNVDA